jgi:phosphatidylserine decarboxylase
MPMAREGWPFILLPAGLGCGLFLAGLPWLGGCLLAISLFSAFFFRDPDRIVPSGAGLVVSPADGRIVRVADAPAAPAGIDGTQISIFLSIFDVHVNRAPIAGRIAQVEYNPGEFLPAFDDKASSRNEQNTVTVEDGETRLVFKQIAGLIARRIVFRKEVGDTVGRGERVGLIRFGSRVDVFVPQGFEIRVRRGERVAAGASILAERR